MGGGEVAMNIAALTVSGAYSRFFWMFTPRLRKNSLLVVSSEARVSGIGLTAI